MDADALGRKNAALQRARLHVRGGRRRLRQGKISAGLVTLYDALDHALEWYAMAPGKLEEIGLERRRHDSRALFAALSAAGILDGGFDYDGFDALVERALGEELPGCD